MVITICILPLPGRLMKKGMKPGLALMRIGSGGEEDEDKQAFERLKGLGDKLRDAMPFGARGAEEETTTAS